MPSSNSFLNLWPFPIGKFVSIALLTSISISVTAESQVEWAERVLKIQSSIDNDAPLAETTWVGTHNSFANNNDDNLMDYNQPTSLTAQLNSGVRELVFDLHWDSDAIRMCHNNVTRYGECIDGITGNRKFYKGLEDIRDWINDGNQDQVVLLKLEMAADAKNNINKVEKKIDGKIYDLVYRTELTSYHGNHGSDGCTEIDPATLTKSDVLNAGKNIILFTSANCIDDNGFNDMTFYSGDMIEDVNSVSSADSWADGKKHTVMSRVKDGTTRDGQLGGSDAKMHPSNAYEFMMTGLNIFEVYGFGATNSSWKVDGEYPIGPEDMVWSWSEIDYEPNGSGSCVQLNTTDGRFIDTNCAGEFYAACRKRLNDDGSKAYYEWALTTQRVTYDSAETQCQLDHGSLYQYATPRNARELNALNNARLDANLSSENIWINYVKTNNSWVADIGE